jgi:phospholipase C
VPTSDHSAETNSDPAADAPVTGGISRRRLLSGAALAGGLGAASLALPPNVRKALAEPAPKHFSPREIKHVVLLMQENRSFDHYFGTLPGVRGFGDKTAKRMANGRSVFYQPDPSNPRGYLLPYHLDSLNTGAQAIPSTNHNWDVQHNAWNNGANDNWLPAHITADGADVGPFTMGYYERQDIPFQFALAEHFTIFDAYHCSVFGPTNPNRLMWLTGTIDPNGEQGGPAIDNTLSDGQYRWPTYAEALTEAGVSWKFYQGGYSYNPLVNMAQYVNADPNSTLYRSAIPISQPGQFEYDAVHGKLPAVSWIFPDSHDVSEHPSALPAAGANFVASKLDAIAANRELWESTVFILNYDENDGLFDHVVPPTPRAGTPDEFVTKSSPYGTPGNGLPVGLGFRVPLIIVSPWTAGGWVCSDLSDHTSVLQFLEVVTGVASPNISAWRRRTTSDLTGAFAGQKYEPTPPVLPDTAGALNLATFTSKLPLPEFPGAKQSFPTQEPGRRPHTR